ncbi:SRPBCC domain-containing protein [Catellatospora sichuanensis]|uniref:SRPBCC domain-containing protein n=1 Tax=Catellatospora sichuanensis TaxID=1969805 RepID=UPI00164317CB|nr:SRPBCC domain-containing protein [Catellatospora sichuanensis]
MTELRLDVDLSHPRARVWRALTEQRLLREWFVPTDLAPTAGDTFRAFPPPGLAGLATPFDLDVVAVSAQERLAMHWRDDHTHTEVDWSLADTEAGCRLTVLQTGFFGVDGTQRRRELRRSYQFMFGDQLPAALDRLASGEVDLGGVRADLHTAIPRRRETVALDPAPAQLPSAGGSKRLRLLSLAGAVVLVVLISTAVAVMIGGNSGGAPGADTEPVYGLGSGVQPGVIATDPAAAASGSPRQGAPGNSPQPGVSGSPGASPLVEATASPPTGMPLTANYRTIALLGLGGFDTEVTVRNPGTTPRENWTVVLTMPADRAVENRSTSAVNFTQDGTKVTVTPVGPARTVAANGSVTFIIRFPALLALGQAITACTVDGIACTGS